MSKKTLLIIIIPITVLIIGIGLRIYQKLFVENTKHKASQGTNRKVDKKKDKKSAFKVIKVQKVKKSHKLIYYETLLPKIHLKIYSKHKGYVDSLSADVGDRVYRDSTLLNLDDVDLVKDKLEKEAQLKTALSAIKEQRVYTKHKKIVYDRAKRAYEKNIISISELDEAKYSYQTAKTKIETLNYKVGEIRASLDRINNQISFMHIKSPINGIISKRLVEIGALIKANELLFEIMNVSKLKVIVHVPQKDLKHILEATSFNILKGTSFYIYLPTLEKQIRAKVKLHYPMLDKTTKTLNLELEIDNKGLNLKPGLEIQVIITSPNKEVVELLQDDLFYDEINKMYMVLEVLDGKVYKRKLKVLDTGLAGKLIIESGLRGGEDSQILIPYRNDIEDGRSLESIFIENPGSFKSINGVKVEQEREVGKEE